jgi:hypothetical protein
VSLEILIHQSQQSFLCDDYAKSLEKQVLAIDAELSTSDSIIAIQEQRADSLRSQIKGRGDIIKNRDGEVGILKKKVIGLKLLLGGSLVLTIVVIVIAL